MSKLTMMRRPAVHQPGSSASRMRILQCTFCLFALVAAPACSLLEGRLPSLPRVHKITTQQGNVITQEMVDQLRPGMTKSQVHFVMGEPILSNLFDPDRWVYVYTLQQPDQPLVTLHLTVLFEDDKLVTMTGELAPKPPSAGAAADDGAAHADTAPAAEATPDVDTTAPASTPLETPAAGEQPASATGA